MGLRELHLFIPEFALYDRDFFKGIINPVVFLFDDRIPGVIIPATEHGVGKLARIVYFGTVGQVRPGDQVILTVGQIQVNPLVSLQVADTFCPGHHEFPVAVVDEQGFLVGFCREPQRPLLQPSCKAHHIHHSLQSEDV